MYLNVFNVNNTACQFENFIDVLPRKMQFPVNTIPTPDSSQSPTADLFAKKFWKVFTMTPQKKTCINARNMVLVKF